MLANERERELGSREEDLNGTCFDVGSRCVYSGGARSETKRNTYSEYRRDPIDMECDIPNVVGGVEVLAARLKEEVDVGREGFECGHGGRTGCGGMQTGGLLLNEWKYGSSGAYYSDGAPARHTKCSRASEPLEFQWLEAPSRLSLWYRLCVASEVGGSASETSLAKSRGVAP